MTDERAIWDDKVKLYFPQSFVQSIIFTTRINQLSPRTFTRLINISMINYFDIETE